MKRYISLLCLTFVSLVGIAQVNDTINRMVLIESTYNPIIAGAVKRNFIPDAVSPSMQKEQVVYADENQPIQRFVRGIDAVQSIALEQEDRFPGYVHLGYGNYNNLNGLATYSVNIKENQNLAFKAHLHGWNGYIKNADGDKWFSALHDMGVNADYRLSLGKAELEFGGSAVNYLYNYQTRNLGEGYTNDQQSMMANAYFKLRGIAREHYTYQLDSRYTYFDRATLWGTAHNHCEQHLHTMASFSADFYEKGIATLRLRSDLLMYRGLEGYRNYYSLGFTPEWNYRYGNWRFLAGANLDFLTHNGPIVQASPQCSISYVPAKTFSADFVLNGGRDITTLSRLYAVSPYWASAEQLRSSYTYLNAQMGANLRLFEGLSIHLGGGYKVVADALFSVAADTLGFVYSGVANHNARILYAEGDVRYLYKEILQLSADARYNHWMVKGQQSVLGRAPQLDVNLLARIRIIKGLYLNSDCRYVTFTEVEDTPREESIINWSLGAHYAMDRQWSFFLDGHNLLNRRYQHYAGYPSQGFNVMAGAVFKF